MTRTALILAAHGSRQNPTAGAIIRAHADRIARMQLFDEVAVAFHQGTPTFAAVLDTIEAVDVTVVPVMASAGYYADTVLPRALASSSRWAQVRLAITRPIGTCPAIKSLACDRIVYLLQRYALQPDRTSLVVVGHGTERHRSSRDSAVDLTNALRERRVCAEAVVAFLDEQPLVDGVHGVVTQPNVLVLPFLIGGGYHHTRDIPLRLGMQPPDGGSFPCGAHLGGRFIVCDAAMGGHPQIADIIVQLAAQHLSPPGIGPRLAPPRAATLMATKAGARRERACRQPWGTPSINPREVRP